MEQELNGLYHFNKYQTPLTEELKNSLHKEVWLDLLEYINSIEFIKRLIAPEKIRGFAKDRTKDEEYDDDLEDSDLEDSDTCNSCALYYRLDLFRKALAAADREKPDEDQT